MCFNSNCRKKLFINWVFEPKKPISHFVNFPFSAFHLKVSKVTQRSACPSQAPG